MRLQYLLPLFILVLTGCTQGTTTATNQTIQGNLPCSSSSWTGSFNFKNTNAEPYPECTGRGICDAILNSVASTINVNINLKFDWAEYLKGASYEAGCYVNNTGTYSSNTDVNYTKYCGAFATGDCPCTATGSTSAGTINYDKYYGLTTFPDRENPDYSIKRLIQINCTDEQGGFNTGGWSISFWGDCTLTNNNIVSCPCKTVMGQEFSQLTNCIFTRLQ